MHTIDTNEKDYEKKEPSRAWNRKGVVSSPGMGNGSNLERGLTGRKLEDERVEGYTYIYPPG